MNLTLRLALAALQAARPCLVHLTMQKQGGLLRTQWADHSTTQGRHWALLAGQQVTR